MSMVLLAGGVVAGVVASSVVAHALRLADDDPVARLARTAGAHRVIRARMTGGFAYAACQGAAPNDSLVTGLSCSGPSPTQWREANAMASLAAELRGSVSREHESRRHHATGSWNMIWRNADPAIEQLRAAARLDPASAEVQSDLAAAYLLRAEVRQDPLSIVDAYAANDSALTLDPAHVQAAFNRGLILEQLQLTDLAIQQWQAYVHLDGASPWATEARERLQRLVTSLHGWDGGKPMLQAAIDANDDDALLTLARRYPRRLRDESERALFAWARGYGTDTAAIELRTARLLARAVSGVTGDALIADVVASIDEAAGPHPPAAIARALRDYDQARHWLDAFELDSAAPWLSAAHRTLGSAANPADYWVTFDQAMTPYQRAGASRYDSALTMLAELRRRAPPRYRVIRARAARVEALIHAIRADYDAAIAAYRATIVEGVGSGDQNLESRPRATLALLYSDLRGEDVAWRELYGALQALGTEPDDRRSAQRVFTAASDLSWRRSPGLSLLFQREAVRLADMVDGTGTMAVSARATEAELLSRQGLSERARQSVQEARAAARRIRNDSIRAIKDADVDLVEGEVILGASPDSAIQVLRRAVDRYRDTQYLLEIDRAEMLLANAYAKLGRIDAAREAFDAALAETERQRAEIADRNNRIQFLDVARPVIDRVLRFSLDRGDTVGAFDFFERMRSRVLLERVEHTAPIDRAGSGIALEQVRRRVPRGSRVISYAVLEGELVSWLVTANGVSMHREALPAAMDQTVERFTTLIESRASGEEIRRISAQLYRVLIGPWAGQLEDGASVIIVPDRWLHFVPFAALADPASGRFLVESVELTVAPSLTLYEASLERYRALRSTGSQQLFAVGNPAFNESIVDLPRLPGAELEATRVARNYSHPSIALRSAATKRAFLRGARDADIVHFAGHGVIVSDAPLLSHLVLAPEPNDAASSSLYAQELFGVSLPRTRLAILSGCHTARGRVSDTEGPSSLARALFAAGVPAVIASLWAVDDAATADFFTMYHQEVSRGVDPTTALRDTQRQWLARSTDRWGQIATWAGFQLFGATTRVAPN